MNPRIVSGIQPSGQVHIGNYLGMLSQNIKLQNSGNYECFFPIVDYHSITIDYDPKEKPTQILDLALDMFALGFDQKKSTIFLQSQVPEHTELAWIFNTITPTSELNRMTQFKDKSSRQEKNINAGLYTYPTLMAADILLYEPEIVPVGDDQIQHIELANLIAKKFNNRFGETFKPVKPQLTDIPRAMSLTHPDRKMSKTEPQGCLFLTDEPDVIKKKVRKAVTDNQGLENLFLLLNKFANKSDIQKLQTARADGGLQNIELKDVLSQAIINHFEYFRVERKKLKNSPDEIKKSILDGSKTAQKIASKKLAEVKAKIGLKL